MLTHYDVLSVDPTAEFETIQRAWRVKVRLLHPDRHRDSPKDVQAEAEKETLRVNNAWDTLRDPQKRREYDVYLMAVRGLERTREPDEPEDSAADDGQTHREWLSPHTYLTLASILIIVVGTGFLVAGAVLLAHLTQ
jgi:curved DNA-binding protein CbpA